MSKVVLTVEESARLIELGVPKSISTVQYCKIYDNPNEQYPTVFRLEDLLRILPKKIKGGSTTFRLLMGVDISDNYWVKYVSEPWGVDSLESYQEEKELIDAIYNMIVWIRTNNDMEL